MTSESVISFPLPQPETTIGRHILPFIIECNSGEVREGGMRYKYVTLAKDVGIFRARTKVEFVDFNMFSGTIKIIGFIDSNDYNLYHSCMMRKDTLTNQGPLNSDETDELFSMKKTISILVKRLKKYTVNMIITSNNDGDVAGVTREDYE